MCLVLEKDDVKSLERGADLREEADLLQSERISWLKKSVATFKQTSLTASGQAAFFSDQGHSLTSRVERLHRLAAENILEEQNPGLSCSTTLDLHYLRVEEAKRVAEAFVRYHLHRSRAPFSIITGRGQHSQKGSSRLGPAIWSLLKSLNVRFTFNGGSVFIVEGGR
jgi:DNA-nicking Smr family endonuclease